jgi:carbamoyl-phosphate synthase large subunit
MGYQYGYLWNTHCPHIGLPDGKTEYSQKAIHERRSEEARHSAIAHGDLYEKHPQEIEFAQHLMNMIKTKGKTLPIHSEINILIPSCGRRVELVRNFKDIFKIPRWSGKVFTCGIDGYMPAAYESDNHFITPLIIDDNYVDSVIEICKKNNIKYIFPVIDYDVKAISRFKSKILRQAGTEVVTPDYNQAMRCFDKWETSLFFKEFQIPHPETYENLEIENYKDAQGLGEYIEKPRYGFASKEIKTISMNIGDSWNGKDKYVLQKKITGKEYTVDIVSDRSFSLVSLVSRERLSTRGGEISMGRVCNHLHLFSYFANIGKRLELVGPWNVQFIIDENGAPWFIEVNTRFGGGNPMSKRAGQDQALISLKILERDFFGYHYRYLVDWGLVGMRFDDCKYGYFDKGMEDHDGDGTKRLEG